MRHAGRGIVSAQLSKELNRCFHGRCNSTEKRAKWSINGCDRKGVHRQPPSDKVRAFFDGNLDSCAVPACPGQGLTMADKRAALSEPGMRSEERGRRPRASRGFRP